jgi:hypothetical protein
MMTAQKTPRMAAVRGSSPRGTLMAEQGEGRTIRALKEATGLIAVLAAQKVVRIGWRRVTGTEPPASPDDQQIPLGQAVAWTLLLGAAATTARMIAIRYASFLLPRRQREAAAQTKTPDTPATSA